MSNTEIQSKVNELRELRRMADELTAEIESIQDAIKAHMTAIDADTLTGADCGLCYTASSPFRLRFRLAFHGLRERFFFVLGNSDAIKAHMTAIDADTLTGADYKITWKTVTSSRFDSTAFKKAMPELAERFTKSTTSRRFIVA